VVKREWPPCFDSAGASYVFDTRSGFFYEATSDFFYDPKSKMYYSNKKQAYFEYVEGENPPYRPFTPKSKKNDEKDGSSDTEKNEQKEELKGDVKDKATTATVPVEKKKKIAISLKTKAMPSNTEDRTKTNGSSAITKPEVKKVAVEATPPIQKKHAVDIEKWCERAREKAAENGSSSPSQNQVNPEENHDITKHATTAGGKPVCLLCKRKFANAEKLEQHVKLSSLHKKNLEKQALNKNYRDRASERRSMYHTPETKEVDITNTIPSLSQAREVTRTETQDILAQGNIGNAMFQKIASGSVKTVKQGAGDQLRQDWNKIENIANNRGRTNMLSSVAGIGKSI